MQGQLTLDDFINSPYKITKPIRLIELFAGIGSQAMALRDIGADFESYRVVEFDKYAIASYNAIHGTDYPTIDVTQISGEDLGIVDVEDFTYLLTYSFPCTDLSVAGKMQGMAEGSGTRSSLLWEVRRLLDETPNLPQVLLMENVPQVHSKANMPHFERWLKFLEDKGYVNYWQDLNAKDYGVAQSRKRCFVVSILGMQTYRFPEPHPLDKCMKDYLEDEVEEKYYLKSDKAKQLIDKLIAKRLEPRTDGCTNTITTVQKDNLVLIRQATKQGTIPCLIGGVADLNYPTSKTRRGRVIDNGMTCPTLTTEAVPSVIEDWTWEIDGITYLIRIRKLTPKECWRLMGFTDEDFEKAQKVNSNTQLYKQAGNSIVKNVLEEIFRKLIG